MVDNPANGPFDELDDTDQDLLEVFVCRLYDPKSEITDVNRLRLTMFHLPGMPGGFMYNVHYIKHPFGLQAT